MRRAPNAECLFRMPFTLNLLPLTGQHPVSWHTQLLSPQSSTPSPWLYTVRRAPNAECLYRTPFTLNLLPSAIQYPATSLRLVNFRISMKRLPGEPVGVNGRDCITRFVADGNHLAFRTDFDLNRLVSDDIMVNTGI